MLNMESRPTISSNKVHEFTSCVFKIRRLRPERALIDQLVLSLPRDTPEAHEAAGYCVDGLLLAWLDVLNNATVTPRGGGAGDAAPAPEPWRFEDLRVRADDDDWSPAAPRAPLLRSTKQN